MRQKFVCPLAMVALLGFGGEAGTQANAANRDAAGSSTASAASSALTPVKDKTADQVIAEYVAARGGKGKLAAVHSLRMTGTISGSGSRGLPLTVEKKRPNKVRRQIDEPEGKSISATDGDTAWQMGGPSGAKASPIPPQTALRLKRASDIDGPFVNYKAKGHRLDLLGKEKLGNSEAYKLRLKFTEGDEAFFWIDAKSHLLVKSSGLASTPGGLKEVESRYSDYKEAGGVLWPYSEVVTVTGAGITQTYAWSKIATNVKLDDSSFKIPG